MSELTKIEKLALRRAREIIEAWWYEDQGEIQDVYELTDDEMEQMNNVPIDIRVKP